MKKRKMWTELSKIKISEVLDLWLSSILNQRTQKSYRVAMSELVANGFLDLNLSLQQFSLLSPDQIIDSMKTKPIYIKDSCGNSTDLP